jgi:hypothetical protein
MKIATLTGILFVLGCLLASSATPFVDSKSIQDDEVESKQTQPNLLISDPIDPALKHILSSTSDATILEVIIQFDDRTATPEKIEWLAEKGVTGLHLTKVIPSIWTSPFIKNSVSKAAGVSRRLNAASATSFSGLITFTSPVKLISS